jgi:hypothetical protein
MANKGVIGKEGRFEVVLGVQNRTKFYHFRPETHTEQARTWQKDRVFQTSFFKSLSSPAARVKLLMAGHRCVSAHGSGKNRELVVLARQAESFRGGLEFNEVAGTPGRKAERQRAED